MSLTGRPTINLIAYKDTITRWYIEDKNTQKEIRNKLESQFSIKVSERRLRDILHQWDLTVYTRKAEHAKYIERIKYLFNEHLSDQEIMDTLESEGVTDLKRSTMRRIRKAEGMLRRYNSREQRTNYNMSLIPIVYEELNKGKLDGFGRNLLLDHLYKLSCYVSRENLRTMIRELDSEGLDRRTKDLNRVRGHYLVPGPDFIWSLDGHHKLSHWGIQIYACIDAYSRCVLWTYVGISATTDINISQQFLKVCKMKEMHPRIIRVDKGKETPLMGELQYFMARFSERENEDLTFNEILFYGTSTKNQRIEAWWAQLQKSILYRWREYFEELEKAGQWDFESQSDYLAALLVFMPIIREEVKFYTDIWNSHKIRRQVNKPGLVAGKPKFNYFWSKKATHYGRPVPLAELERIEEKFADFDMEEYLPADTINWATEALRKETYIAADSRQRKITLETITSTEECMSDGTRLHDYVYKRLRVLVANHIASGESPQLSHTRTQGGGYKEVARRDGHFERVIRENQAVNIVRKANRALRSAQSGVPALLNPEENEEGHPLVSDILDEDANYQLVHLDNEDFGEGGGDDAVAGVSEAAAASC